MLVNKLMILCTIVTLFGSGFLMFVRVAADISRAAKEKKYGYCTVSDISILWNRLTMFFTFACVVMTAYWGYVVVQTIQ